MQVMEARQGILGADYPDTLTSINNLATTYINQGRWKEAEELEMQVMEIRENVLGTEHPSTLTNMGNLASTYRNHGRWKEAEELEAQATETIKRLLGAALPLPSENGDSCIFSCSTVKSSIFLPGSTSACCRRNTKSIPRRPCSPLISHQGFDSQLL